MYPIRICPTADQALALPSRCPLIRGDGSMSLTADQVRWVAHLSRLQLSDAEVAQMTPQLASIVGYVDQLQKINTDGVEPLVHALEQVNVFRQDELGTSLSPEEALANAPERIGNFFQVPAVLD